ncbi:MAG: DUF4105 domain-containing protein [Chryseolinea sp.]
MKKYLIIVIVCLIHGSISGQQVLSDSTTVSIITCGPHQDAVYYAFGHSAVRVFDRLNGLDYVFNYGIFDFKQANFYLNFAKGNNNYMLAAYEYKYFQQSYIENNRFLHEQELNLTKQQKQKVFDFLVKNALPENASYRYDYFYDNCATRVRDVFVKVLGDDVKFDGSYITTDYSIRQLTDFYLTEQPWGDLGIDIGLGLPMDKKATPYEYMFLPAYLESGFDHATIKNGSAFAPMVSTKKIIYESIPEEVRGLPHPLYVFGVIAFIAIVLCALDFRNQTLSTWFDILLFGVSGLIGILLVALWLFTDHKAAANNFNIAWALPTNFIAVWAFIKNPRWLKGYFLFVALLQFGLLMGWFFLPQQLNMSLIPIVVSLMMRAYIQYVLRNRGVYSKAKIAKDYL